MQILVIIYVMCCCLCGVTLLWALYQTDWSLLLIVSAWILIGIFFLTLSWEFSRRFKHDPEAQQIYEIKRQQQLKAASKKAQARENAAK